MTALALVNETAATLPALVDRAASTLAGARTAAEILEAHSMAAVAVDAAKSAARFAKATRAADELIAAAYRAEADAHEIQALAKRRMAKEYDAAQERHEVQRHGGQGKRDIPNENIPSTGEIGVSSKFIHEARQIRDAEIAEPGVVRRALDEALAAGEEPTGAVVKRAVLEVVGTAPSKPKPARGRQAIVSRVREAVGLLSGLPPAPEVANYFRGTDDAILVGENLSSAAAWLSGLAQAWEDK